MEKNEMKNMNLDNDIQANQSKQKQINKKKLIKVFLISGLVLLPILAGISILSSHLVPKINRFSQESASIVKPIQISNVNSADQLRNAYFERRNSYNQIIESLGKKLDEVNKKLSEKDIKDEQKASLTNLKYSYFIQAKNELYPLVSQINFLFKLLKQAEKNDIKKTIKIFHTNDEHGRLVFDNGKFSKYSGLARLGKYFSKVEHDLLLSSGDLIQGLPLSDSDKGETITKVAKYIGYDMVAVGNHEFDFGLEWIKKLDSDSQKTENSSKSMPFLSANVYYKDLSKSTEAKPENYDQSKVGKRVFKPYIVKKLENGLNVAIFGLTTPDTVYTSNPKNSKLVEFRDIIQSSKDVISEIKKENPDVNFIIASVHLGTNRSDYELSSDNLSKNVDEIDLIFDGHSHTFVKIGIPKDGKVLTTQTQAYTKYLGDLDVVYNTKTKKIEQYHQELRNIDQIDLMTSDNSDNWISDLEKKFNVENDVVIFNLPIDLKRNRFQATSLGVIISNSIARNFIQNEPWKNKNEKVGSLDNTIGLYNSGGIRADLAAGEIKRKNMLETSPFGDRLSAVKVSGKTLLEVFKHSASKIKSGGFGQFSSNVEYKIDGKKQTDKNKYELDIESIKINNKKINLNDSYYIVTNDFITTGGDGYSMLNTTNKDVELIFEGDKTIEIMINYFKDFVKSDAKVDKSKFENVILDFKDNKVFEKQIVNLLDDDKK